MFLQELKITYCFTFFKMKILNLNKIKLFIIYIYTYIFVLISLLFIQIFDIEFFNFFLKSFFQEPALSMKKRDYNTFNSSIIINENSDSDEFTPIIIDTLVYKKRGVFPLNISNSLVIKKFVSIEKLTLIDVLSPVRENLIYDQFEYINKLTNKILYLEPENLEVNLKSLFKIKNNILRNLNFQEVYIVTESLKNALLSLTQENNVLLSHDFLIKNKILLNNEITRISKIQNYLLNNEKVFCSNYIYNHNSNKFINIPKY